jgi:hypothetical protein
VFKVKKQTHEKRDGDAGETGINAKTKQPKNHFLTK